MESLERVYIAHPRDVESVCGEVTSEACRFLFAISENSSRSETNTKEWKIFADRSSPREVENVPSLSVKEVASMKQPMIRPNPREGNKIRSHKPPKSSANKPSAVETEQSLIYVLKSFFRRHVCDEVHDLSWVRAFEQLSAFCLNSNLK